MDSMEQAKPPEIVNAIFSGDLDLVKCIMNNGGVDLTKYKNRYFLSWVVDGAKTEILVYLLNTLTSTPSLTSIVKKMISESLFYAVCQGELECVQIILTYKPDLNDKCIYPWDESESQLCFCTPLAAACYKSKPNGKSDSDTRKQLAEMLLKEGASVNKCVQLYTFQPGEEKCSLQVETSPCMLSPLHIAAGNNLLDVCRLLLRHGANVNERCVPEDFQQGVTPLLAVLLTLHSPIWREGDLHDMVQLLLGNGADVFMCTTGTPSFTPLQCAVSNALVESRTLRLLLQKGTSVNANDGTIEESPLWLLATSKDRNDIADCMECFIRYGAWAKYKDKLGKTLFHHHIRYGRADGRSVKTLYKYYNNSDIINMQTNKGGTTLTMAVRNEHSNMEEVVRALIELGVNVNLTNFIGRSPLYYACVNYFVSVEIIRLLLSKGANVNKWDQNKMTPLGAAVASRRSQIVQILLENGAHPDGIQAGVVPCSTNPLVYAIRHYSDSMLPIIEMLLARGASPNWGGENWRNRIRSIAPLNAAVECSSFQPLHLLLQFGCKINENTGTVAFLTAIENALKEPDEQTIAILEILIHASIDQCFMIQAMQNITQQHFATLDSTGVLNVLQERHQCNEHIPELFRILKLLSSPMTLKHLARLTIHSSLLSVRNDACLLPLPPSLLGYVSFKTLY